MFTHATGIAFEFAFAAGSCNRGNARAATIRIGTPAASFTTFLSNFPSRVVDLIALKELAQPEVEFPSRISVTVHVQTIEGVGVIESNGPER